MQHALFLSPHRHDVAFSCAGTLIRLLQHHWKITLITIFAVPQPPVSQALHAKVSCEQSPESDNAVENSGVFDIGEEAEFARTLSLHDWRNWEFPDAAQRGYSSIAHEHIRADDRIWRHISDLLCEVMDEIPITAVFAPQGLDQHVDALQTIRAVAVSGDLASKTWWYRDLPYALRFPEAPIPAHLPSGLEKRCVPLKEMDVERKILGCWTYAAQIPGLFGGNVDIAHKLRAFHRNEAQCLGTEFMERYAECFAVPHELPPLL